MKPSERIKEIVLKKSAVNSINTYPSTIEKKIDFMALAIDSVFQYLDEVYEAEKSAREQLKKDLVDL